MAIEYKWTLGLVQGKKEFTDKNGNKRNNVIKSVELVFQGKKENEENVIKESVLVVFDLADLSSFEEVEDLTQEMILNWALNKLHPQQKIDIENNIKSHFGEHESNLIQIKINE